MPGGRPTDAPLDNPEVVDLLCERVASGLGIKEVCEMPDMPSKTAVYARMASDEEFRTRIAQAREAQQESEADKCVEMADEATMEDWQVVKLRIWARQWRASKLAPRTYGDKLAVGGAKDLPPIQTEDMSENEIARRIAFMLSKGLRSDGS